MKTELRANENIVKEGPANLQRGAETVGGKLTLTSQRLVFESHRFNIQTGASEIPLEAVVSATPCWTKLLGFIPIGPNSLSVKTRDGEEYRFVLWGRPAWIMALEVLLGSVQDEAGS